jgi:tRNA threonylcarbamoyladenosine biosynthesis protein TsaE
MASITMNPSAQTIMLKTLAHTQAFGRLLGQAARPGDVICLDGDLGAGKTTLTQAIAAGLEVPPEEYVTSPSFAIVHEYQGRMALYHMDWYRLSHASEVEDLGLDEYFSLSGLTVVEWCRRAPGLVPPTRLSLTLTMGPDESRLVLCDHGIGSWQMRWPSLQLL